jgi:hypothetical protein
MPANPLIAVQLVPGDLGTKGGLLTDAATRSHRLPAGVATRPAEDDGTVTDEHGPARPDPALYPDIAQAGSLRDALQAQFDGDDLPLRAAPEPAPGWRHVGARVQNADRLTTAVMGKLERVFVLEFWSRRVCMAHGRTDDLRAVAGAMNTWQSGARVRDLSSAWPFVRFSALAEAHERGEAAEYTWRQYRENPQQAPGLTHLHAFIAEAVQEPRLRALLPFTSHGTLGFSRTIGHPHSGDCPWVEPLDEDRYLVRAADGRELGTAGPAGSVALVVAALND